MERAVTAEAIVAPTDAQLGYIAALAFEKGYPMPVVYSKTHASILIDEIRSGSYRPPGWADDDLPEALWP